MVGSHHADHHRRLAERGGKTTIACALAVAAGQAGLDTVLIDLDPQASASKWGDLREADTPIVTSTQATRLERILNAAREAGAELIIIDTAPHAADAALTGRRTGAVRLYPGGTENSSIFLTLSREIPKWRAAARALIPSRQARRTLRYSSTV